MSRCICCNRPLTDVEMTRKNNRGEYLDTCTSCTQSIRYSMLSSTAEQTIQTRVTVRVKDEFDVDQTEESDYDSWDGWYKPEFGRMPNDE